jgi:hypothetical protein
MRLFRQLLLLAITIIAGLSNAANAQISPLSVIDQELRANCPDVAGISHSAQSLAAAAQTAVHRWR